MTQCITLGTNGYCFSRRDWSEYSDTGCRVGYHAANLQRRGQSWFRREVCVPDGVSSGDGWWGGWTDDSEGSGFIYPDPELDPTIGIQGSCSATGARGAPLPWIVLLSFTGLGLAVMRRR